MSIDGWFERSALIASYVAEFLAIPSHAERLASLRLARHRSEVAQRRRPDRARLRIVPGPRPLSRRLRLVRRTADPRAAALIFSVSFA